VNSGGEQALLIASEPARPYGNSDLEERTLAYAAAAIDLFRILQRGEAAARHRSNQYLRSATSIGANVAEAQVAESKSDFAHKYSIARKEARESLYWLRLFQRVGFVEPEELDSRIGETRELLAIFTAIIKTAKPRTG
jgi:four helix bundle protein